MSYFVTSLSLISWKQQCINLIFTFLIKKKEWLMHTMTIWVLPLNRVSLSQIPDLGCFPLFSNPKEWIEVFFLTVWVFLCWKLYKILLTMLILHITFLYLPKNDFYLLGNIKIFSQCWIVDCWVGISSDITGSLKAYKSGFGWQKSLFY